MPTYISAEGLEDLKAEFEKRKKITRKEISEKISAAKEMGDLSENFEYHEAKEQQGLNEGRILQLEAMILESIIVEQSSGGDYITLGVTFTAELNGDEKTFQMVGSAEADPMTGKISNDSPIGNAFMDKGVGDEVTVEVPSGQIIYIIKGIK
jgi:transcription elongation factor GreA